MKTKAPKVTKKQKSINAAAALREANPGAIFYRFTLNSSNSKTGEIPVSTTSNLTCPDGCPLKYVGEEIGGCFAGSGPISIVWKQTGEGLYSTLIDGFCAKIARLPKGTLWRHNQAGDLPGFGEMIDFTDLAKIVMANIGRRGFTYTHKNPFDKWNAAHIQYANEMGFTINLSANSIGHADILKTLGIAPVACIVPLGTKGKTLISPAGNRIVICPKQIDKEKWTCSNCGLCQKANRPCIVGFLPHGPTTARANKVANA